MEKRKGEGLVFGDEDLDIAFKEGETYYIVDSFNRKPLIIEAECHRLDPEEYDWPYGLYEKKVLFGIPNYPIGRYTHPKGVATKYFKPAKRRKILNNYFFKDLSEAVKRAIYVTFEGSE